MIMARKRPVRNSGTQHVYRSKSRGIGRERGKIGGVKDGESIDISEGQNKCKR